jgi:hypothetical protein
VQVDQARQRDQAVGHDDSGSGGVETRSDLDDAAVA